MRYLIVVLVIICIFVVIIAHNGRNGGKFDFSPNGLKLGLLKLFGYSDDGKNASKVRNSRRTCAENQKSSDMGLESRLLKLADNNTALSQKVSALETQMSSLLNRLQIIEREYNELINKSQAKVEAKENLFSSVNEKKTEASFKANQRFYVTSPSSISPIAFASGDLENEPGNHYYCVHVINNKKAELLLNNNLEAVRSFLSSLAYQYDCVEVLSRPTGSAKSIEIVRKGELEFNGDSWILKTKIQININ